MLLLRPRYFQSPAGASRFIRCISTAMPLRAKILPSGTGRQPHIRKDFEYPRELPDDEPNDVLFNTSFGVRTIELNRPKKLNSLNGSMIRKIIPRLLEWAKSDMANVIIMKGAGDRALCAGGDVAALALWNQEGLEGKQRSKDYFCDEYQLDHLIATYPKPYIAFMDGITMGGGVGLSVHAPFRIATERTRFAMPETSIGFFPEVGASFFLPRLDGMIGKYLALTSENLLGVNTFYAGLATHYIDSSSLPDLEHRLAELVFKDSAGMYERCKIIDSTIEEFVTGLPHDQPMLLAGKFREAIDRCFASDDINEILDSLERENSEWGRKTSATIQERSPTSVKVTNLQMRLGRDWSIDATFQREAEIAAHFMEHPDFVEGVSAKLINKTQGRPNWQPSTLDEVKDEDVQAFFRMPEGKRRMPLIIQGADYNSYPQGWIGLPTEINVRDAVYEGKMSGAEIVDHFVQLKEGKVGVREKVQEIITRTTKDQNGIAQWQNA